jgi:hypothetical protein
MAEEIGALRAVLALESAAFDRGVQSARQSLTNLERGMSQTGRAAQVVGATVDRQAGAFARFGQAAQRNSGALQNFGFQVQDFAVQVGAGTSATQALAQQLPQLLGGFGLLGIAIGTASAVAIPLGAALLGLGTKAATLKDALDEVNTAIQGTSDLAKIARGDLEGLQERYGTLTPQVLRLVEAQKQVGLRELADSAQSLNEQLTALYNGNAWLNVGRAEDLANGLSLGTKASRELANAMQAMGQAETLDGQLAIVSQMRERFVEMVGPVGEMTARQRDFYFSLVESEGKMRELKARVDLVADSVERLASPLEMARFATVELSDAASVLAGYFSSADSAVAGLASTLSAAAANAWDLASARMAAEQQLDQMAFGNSPGGRALNQYGSRAPGGTAAQNALADRNNVVSISGRGRSGGGGGGGRRSGGGGGGGVSDEMREAARIYDETRTAAEKYATELARLNTLREGGYLTADTYARAMEDLRDKTGETESAFSDLGSTVGEAFTSFVTGAKSGQEALSDLLTSLADTLANSAFQAIAGSLFGKGSEGGFLAGLLGNANGNAFSGGRVAAFANGGIVTGPTVFPMANGAGLMGEAGPEAIMPLTRIGGKLGVRAAGGGGTVIHVDARYASEGTAEMIVRALREAVPGIIQSSVGASRGAAARGR